MKRINYSVQFLKLAADCIEVKIKVKTYAGRSAPIKSFYL